MTDRAKFREADIKAVWGEYPEDPLTGETADLDPGHILARGYVHGVGPKHEGRPAFSSIYNFYPLPRRIHNRGKRDDTHIRAYCLCEAYKKVQKSIALGHYEPRDEDAAFLEIRAEWFLKHFPSAA